MDNDQQLIGAVKVEMCKVWEKHVIVLMKETYMYVREDLVHDDGFWYVVLIVCTCVHA